MKYSKAIAALVAAAVSIAATFQFEIDEELQAALVTVLTALAVYLAPANKP